MKNGLKTLLLSTMMATTASTLQSCNEGVMVHGYADVTVQQGQKGAPDTLSIRSTNQQQTERYLAIKDSAQITAKKYDCTLNGFDGEQFMINAADSTDRVSHFYLVLDNSADMPIKSCIVKDAKCVYLKNTPQ